MGSLLNIRARGVGAAVSRSVILATDASVQGPRAVGGGWVATTGHWGLCAHGYPDVFSGVHRVAVTELRAVSWGLDHVMSTWAGPVEVWCDSEQALGYLRRWAAGGGDLPEGYSTRVRADGNISTLMDLMRVVQYAEGMLTFRHVRGHTGDPLNEAADSLARLGVRASRKVVPAKRAGELAAQWAREGLAAWAASRSSVIA